MEQSYVYEGAVISNTLSEQKALGSGKFLLTTDSQTKQLESQDTIF